MDKYTKEFWKELARKYYDLFHSVIRQSVNERDLVKLVGSENLDRVRGLCRAIEGEIEFRRNIEQITHETYQKMFKDD